MTGTLLKLGSEHPDVKRTTDFDTTKPETVEETRKAFDSLIAAGYKASVEGELVNTFDETKPETVMIPRLVGG